MEGTWSWSGNHRGVTVAPTTKEVIIRDISQSSQYNDLYASILSYTKLKKLGWKMMENITPTHTPLVFY